MADRLYGLNSDYIEGLVGGGRSVCSDKACFFRLLGKQRGDWLCGNLFFVNINKYFSQKSFKITTLFVLTNWEN